MTAAEELTRIAVEADALHARSRALLVGAARKGAAAGMSQREIAAAIGRSQPEVSRLLHFQPSTPRGHLLMLHRDAVITVLRSHDLINPRVVGSVARGTDGPDSDIDLLVDAKTPVSLFQIARAESEVSDILGCATELVIADQLRPHVRERMEPEAARL